MATSLSLSLSGSARDDLAADQDLLVCLSDSVEIVMKPLDAC